MLNYWHFAARLEAEGYRTLIDGRSILQGLGISEPVANIGYVFKQSWADRHKQSKQALTGKSEQLQPGTFW